MLSLIIFLPVISGLLIAACGKRFSYSTGGVVLGVSAGMSLAAIVCILDFARGGQMSSMTEFIPWIEPFGLNYFTAVTPLNAVFILLNAVLMPVVIWTAMRRNGGHPVMAALLLVEQGLLNGVFAMQNLLLWFFFWELTLVPVFFLIKEFGAEQRAYAAYKFFLYTLLGSLPMLLSFLCIYYHFGTLDLGLAQIAPQSLAGLDSPGAVDSFQPYAFFVFIGMFLGVAVKIPLYPFHSWQPDAYTQAPTPVSIFLTGIMSKMGVYGLMLLFVLLPVTFGVHAEWIVWLAAITMLASITTAILKNDLKEIIAYSSLNHVAICALGIGAMALMGVNQPVAQNQIQTGVLVQVFSHGLTGALFFFLAGVLEKRSGTRVLGIHGGLRHKMPVYAGLLGVAAFATIGLPGLSGFIGEFLVFKGGFLVSPYATGLAFLGLIPMTLVMLKVINAVLNGPLAPFFAQVHDLNRAERVVALPLALLIILVGLWPKTILWIWNW